jgi:PAS domain S-box-containing protein
VKIARKAAVMAKANSAKVNSGAENHAGLPPISRFWSSRGFFYSVLGLCAVMMVVPLLLQLKFYAYGLTPVTLSTLAGLILLIYAFGQRRHVWHAVQQVDERDELFRIISMNAADMIALVDVHGNRLYNSPAYTRILGYSPEELQSTSAFEQIHPDDREKVIAAGKEARETGAGRRLEYRIRHKDGTWRVLESTASAIRNIHGMVEKLVIINRDITDRKEAEEKLQRSAFYDNLTDLPNRGHFMDRLQRTFDYSKQTQDFIYAVLFIDVDNFKRLNDTVGHLAGDQVIKEVGQRLVTCLRRQDEVSRGPRKKEGGYREGAPVRGLVARLGGDEFAVLLSGIRDPNDAMRAAKRIQQALALPLTFNKQELTVTASIGIALSTTPQDAPESLLRNADTAMYRAKSLGKSRCELFDLEMHTKVVDRLKLEADLRDALARQEFRLHFQPIVSLESGRVKGFETLLRWQRPGAGLVEPKEFIHVAEETGLILQIGRWTLQESCRQVRMWQVQYPSDQPLSVSVNVSPKQFAQANLIYETNLALQESGIDPRSLHLEITETMAMSDSSRTSQILSQLKGLKVGISIDDFGTGYSSLDQLRRFPVDILKIDRSFVSGMDVDSESYEIVRLIAMLAHNLGLKIIAEGAETAQQVENLKALGCEYGQGYYFSKPLDKESAQALLLADNSKVLTAAAKA